MWTCLQILSPLGRISEALADLTKAIQLQPSARLYRHRGTLLFISEVWSSNVRPLCVHTCFDGALGWSCALPSRQDYVTAMEDFQQSLELKKNQPIAMLYKGLTFFHRGMLKVRCSFSIVALFFPQQKHLVVYVLIIPKKLRSQTIEILFIVLFFFFTLAGLKA